MVKQHEFVYVLFKSLSSQTKSSIPHFDRISRDVYAL